MSAGWHVNPSPSRGRRAGSGERSSSGGVPITPPAHTTMPARTRYSPGAHSEGAPLAPGARSVTRTCSVRSGPIRRTSARVTTSTPARSARGSWTRFVPCFA